MALALPLFLARHASLFIVLLSAVCSGRPVSFLIWSVHLICGLPGGLFALKLPLYDLILYDALLTGRLFS